MLPYARIINNELQYPSPNEFRGVSNWMTHDVLLRLHHYLPLVGTPEDRENYTAVPSEWHVVPQSETHIEPRQCEEDIWYEDPVTHERRIIDKRIVMKDTEVILDKTYIQVDNWNYVLNPPDPKSPVRYSRYLIKQACERRDLWEHVKSLIESAGKWESFLIINDISSDNEELSEALPLIIQTFGQELVDTVLAESVIE